MRRPNQLSDELDAVLDGRPVEINDDLAPLIEAAAELRAALEAVELDPDVAERHLGRVLDGQATVLPLPVRPQPQPQASPWRRRVAAVALAAALTVVPAAMASASTLPGDTLYPMKLAVEQLRVAAMAWSSTGEASERTKIAEARADEFQKLVDRHDIERIPPAMVAAAQALSAAQAAVSEIRGADAQTLKGRLHQVKMESSDNLKLAVGLTQEMPDGKARTAIIEAVRQADDVIPVPPTTTPPPPSAPPTTDPTPPSSPPTAPASQTSSPPPTTAVPTTTPTTTLPPTTTEAPNTTAGPTQTSAAASEEGGTEDDGAGDQTDATDTTAP